MGPFKPVSETMLLLTLSLLVLTHADPIHRTEGEGGSLVREPCPDPFVTIHNVQCSTTCAQYGEEYLWCRLANGDWDYCSEDHHHTRYGEKCGSSCDQRGEAYYWCDKVNGSWDYCSPRCKGDS